jgi:hypothetical protein
MVTNPKNTISLISKRIPLLLAVAIVFLGYWRVFVGADFFVHEDTVAISNYTFGTAMGNGWRPDKGLGVSFFWGDPAIWHAWSPLVILEKLVESRVLTYSMTILLLGILASLAMYYALRNALPSMNRYACALLAPVVVFCADQAGQHYLRVSISGLAGIPLMLLLVHRHLSRPSWINYPLAGVLFLAVAFLGTVRNLFDLLMIGAVYALSAIAWRKRPLGLALITLSTLFAAGAFIFLALGAWIIYPMLVELVTMGYVREKILFSGFGFAFQPDVKGIIHYLIGILSVDLAPVNNEFLLGAKPFLYVFNVLPFFPLVLLYFLARKSQGEWEFGLKALLLIFLAYMGLVLSDLVPGFREIVGFIGSKTMSLVSMYSLIFPIQILLIGHFLMSANQPGWLIPYRQLRIVQQGLAVVLIVMYVGVLAAAFLLPNDPHVLSAFLNHLISTVMTGDSVFGLGRDHLVALVTHDLLEYQRITGGPMLAFLLITLATIIPFLRDAWLKKVASVPTPVLAGVLLANGLTMSWAIYPLNEEPLVWQQPELKSVSFEPTDRFLFVRPTRTESRVETLIRRASSIEEQKEGRKLGIAEAPGLNLSGLKSFSSRDEADYMFDAFNGDGVKRLSSLRTYYGGPLHVSPLLDMAAVKYYYSDAPLENLPEQLQPFVSAHGVHVYRNRAAWPYFFLAKAVAPEPVTWSEFTPERELAYVSSDHLTKLSIAGQGRIAMDSFSNGVMTFSYRSDGPEMLVVADAWHPQWKASIDGEDAPVIRVNKLFKGVPVPAGEHRVTLYFDTTKYRLGIYLSLAAWVTLIVVFSVYYLRKKSPLHVQQ